MTRVSCPSALGLMDNAQNIAMIRIIRKCEKYLTLPHIRCCSGFSTPPTTLLLLGESSAVP